MANRYVVAMSYERLWFEKKDRFQRVKLLFWSDGSVTWEVTDGDGS